MRWSTRALFVAPATVIVVFLTAVLVNGCGSGAPLELPTADAGSDATIASGGSATLEGSATGGQEPYTYAWTPTTGLDDATVAQPTASPTVTTEYTLTVTDSNGQTDTDTVTVTVASALAVEAGPNRSIAPSGSAELTGSATGGLAPYTYSWSPTTGLDDATLAQPTASPTVTTEYTLTVTDSLDQTGTDNVMVVVAPPLTASAGGDRLIVQGLSCTVNGEALGGLAPYTYAWTPVTGLSDAAVAEPTASPDETTTYTLTIADAVGQTDSDTMTVNVAHASRISGGDNCTLAMRNDGDVWAWGYNLDGQLGDGTNDNRLTPVLVDGVSDVVSIVTAYEHAVALMSDGTVWAWGDGDYGQLGTGVTSDTNIPAQVVGLTDVVAVDCGAQHTIALRSDGTVWTWGENDYGELGDGTEIRRTVPIQVPTLSDVIAVGAGYYHSLAVTSDGTVWAWGHNFYGQVGDETTEDQWWPIPVLSMSDAVAVTGGDEHSVALRSDGTVWAWGYNGYGQLGNDSTDNSLRAVQVHTLTDVVAIDAGDSHTLALTSDGTVWTWGWNDDYQIGDGTTDDRLTPYQVPGLSDIVDIGGGETHSLAIESDGTVWGWGNGASGALGTGFTDDSLIPVEPDWP